MKRVKLEQLSSMSFTSHFLRGFPLLDVICFGVPGWRLRKKAGVTKILLIAVLVHVADYHIT